MKTETVSDGHSHSVTKDGSKHKSYVKRLWELSKNLPEFEYEVSSFKGFDKDFWFDCFCLKFLVPRNISKKAVRSNNIDL